MLSVESTHYHHDAIHGLKRSEPDASPPTGLGEFLNLGMHI